MLKANTYEPAFADVLMLGQLIDCKEALGLEINLHSMDFSKNQITKHAQELTMDSHHELQSESKSLYELQRKLALYQLLDPFAKQKASLPT